VSYCKSQKRATCWYVEWCVCGSRSPDVSCVCFCSTMMSLDQQKFLADSREISDPLLSSPSTCSEQLQKVGNDSAKSFSGSGEPHRKVPVFQSEEDRLTFDRCLEVDIAPLVSGMYTATSQAIEQNITECSSSTTRTTLNVFTCTTCSKVFTSLSHCQLHCLIHTTARPYHCPWCSYSTNIRGYSSSSV